MAGAARLGVAMPSVLGLPRGDPQVAAGPVAPASSDLVTRLISFNLARLLLA